MGILIEIFAGIGIACTAFAVGYCIGVVGGFFRA